MLVRLTREQIEKLDHPEKFEKYDITAEAVETWCNGSFWLFRDINKEGRLQSWHIEVHGSRCDYVTFSTEWAARAYLCNRYSITAPGTKIKAKGVNQ